MQYLSQAGTNVAAVALYRNDLMHGADEVSPAPKLNQALMDAGYNYDHINADSLMRCATRDEGRDKMLVAQGGAEYRALVLPALDRIDCGAGGEDAELGERGIADSVCGADAVARR